MIRFPFRSKSDFQSSAWTPIKRISLGARIKGSANHDGTSQIPLSVHSLRSRFAHTAADLNRQTAGGLIAQPDAVCLKILPEINSAKLLQLDFKGRIVLIEIRSSIHPECPTSW